MHSERLSLALADGVLAVPPAGDILVLRPAPELDLSDLPRDRLRIVAGFRPDHDAWAARGIAVAPAIDAAIDAATRPAMALVCLPRGRDAGRGMVAAAAAALPPGAPLVLDGQKTDGIDTMLRDLRHRGQVGPAFAKAHGKLFVLENPGAALFADWAAAAAPRRGKDGFVTSAGVFSADGPDPASVLLAGALPGALPGRVADLGAGWGFLSAAILARDGVAHLDLIEAEADALDCARQNITDPRAAFHWADARSFAAAARYGAVVMNPPFHAGRAADPGLGLAFIRAAQSLVSLSGTVWMVANRHLPYEATLREAFREVAEVAGSGGFKVLRASHPVAKATRPAQPPRRRR